MELSSRHGLGRRTREPCIFFASGLGCWKGSRCDFDHVINQEPGYRPRKDVREKVKEELRRCFDENEPEKIYAKLQDAARQSRYAYALIVGYLDGLTPSLKVEDDHGTKKLVFFL
ncbi:unnamed protein product [Cladocopium goreaui]|uniref:C3H1-type domain-containing protein n=1 Tax=Cladocopium goreaui TaxID=2562237 RepID=A0A9P1FXU5_9DINO|nr:unnamed protein product [Cladocopium goreaui]